MGSAHFVGEVYLQGIYVMELRNRNVGEFKTQKQLRGQPMEIEQIINIKSEAEIELTLSIDKILSNFKNQTGLPPYAISINMVESTTMGDRYPTYHLSSVRMRVEIPS